MFRTKLHPLEFQLFKCFTALFFSDTTNSKKYIWNIQVSAGRDSMSLLRLLKNIYYSQFFQKYQKQVIIVVQHTNHQKRGLESDEDEQFVIRHALECGFPVYTSQFQSAQKNLNGSKTDNFQNEARLFRRKQAIVLCKTLMKDYHANDFIIFTGHHAQDHVESILLHLIRGSELNGLMGFTFLEDHFCKPFYDISSNDLNKYASELNLPFRHDSSNDSLQYQRNRVRHRLIPEIKKLNPQFEDAFIKMSQRIRREYHSKAQRQQKSFFDPTKNKAAQKKAAIGKDHKRIGAFLILIHGDTIEIQFSQDHRVEFDIKDDWSQKIYEYFQRNESLKKYLKKTTIENLCYEIDLLIKKRKDTNHVG